MTKQKQKYVDVTYVREDGVKVTMCAPRMPKNAERTWTVEKSRHSVWCQGVSNYTRGTRGTTGTVG